MPTLQKIIEHALIEKGLVHQLGAEFITEELAPFIAEKIEESEEAAVPCVISTADLRKRIMKSDHLGCKDIVASMEDYLLFDVYDGLKPLYLPLDFDFLYTELVAWNNELGERKQDAGN
jgi:hypothetical protein